MDLEIERKFLVEGSWPRPAEPGIALQQVYLPVGDSDMQGRLRLATHADGTQQAWLTLKTPGDLVRHELELPIGVDVAQAALARPELPRLAKTRYALPLPDGLVLEVDVYEGTLAGLVVAEVELPAADTPVTLPPWVGREVTADPAYKNHALARPAEEPGSGPRPR